MTASESGWYPNPDGTPNERYWDGSAWSKDTREYPAPDVQARPTAGSPASKDTTVPEPLSVRVDRLIRRVPRAVYIAIGGLIIGSILILSLFGANSGRSNDASVTSTTKSTPAKKTPVASPTVKATPTKSSPAVIPFGSPIVTPNYSLVLNSVELVDEIETTKGDPITAPAGTKLALVRTTITITGHAQDLSCGSNIYFKAYDSNGSEMAPVFEGNRIPGNPACNYKTSAGETVEWNFAFKLAADANPLLLSVTDMNADGNYGSGEEQLASLQ